MSTSEHYLKRIPPKNLDVADLKIIYLFVFTNHFCQSIRTKCTKEKHLYTQLRYVCVHDGVRCSTTCKLLRRIVAPNNQVIQSHCLVRLHRTRLRGPPTQLEYEMFHFFRLWDYFFFFSLTVRLLDASLSGGSASGCDSSVVQKPQSSHQASQYWTMYSIVWLLTVRNSWHIYSRVRAIHVFSTGRAL